MGGGGVWLMVGGCRVWCVVVGGWCVVVGGETLALQYCLY